MSRDRLKIVAAVLSAVVSLATALAMRDHVRLVEIVALFFGGVGTGASLASLRSGR